MITDGPDDFSDLVEEITELRKGFSSHEAHIEQLVEIQKEIGLIESALCELLPKRIPQLTTQVSLLLTLQTAAEFTVSAVHALQIQAFSTAEALSRISSEYSVNLMYILKGDSGMKTKAFLHHYFESEKKRVSKWKSFAIRENKLSSIQESQRVLDHLTQLQTTCFANSNNLEISWPNAFERFVSVGLEEAYRTAYASSSDSVHSLSSDIFNIIYAHTSPSNLVDIQIQTYFAEKRSFAVYLVAFSILHFCNALLQFADKIYAERQRRVLLRLLRKVQELINQHETHHSRLIETNND